MFGDILKITPGLRVFILAISFLMLCSTSSHSQSVFEGLDEGSDFEEDDSDFQSFTHSRSRREVGELHLEYIVPANYSIHEPPPKQEGNPSQMTLGLLIMNVRGIKEIEEEVTLELNMQVFWQDYRLSEFASNIKSKYVVLNPAILSKLWIPDIFVDNLKTVAQPMLMSKPASLRIYPNSLVRYSTRMTLTMACQMDFHFYPADTQRCKVDIKSYAYMDTELVLSWKERQGASFVHQFNLPNFHVGMDTPESFPLRTTSGAYSSLRFTLLLTRKLSYHLIQTYLPSCLLVMVSWLSFLVPPDSVPGRMAICMTCLLTLIAMFASVRQSTPNVSYVKAIDIWMVVCVFFVFMALAEFCIVLKFLSIRRKEKKDGPNPVAPQTVDPFYGQRGHRGSVASIYYANTGTAQRRLHSPRGSVVYPEESEMMEVPPPPNEGRPPPPLPSLYPKPPPFQIFTQPQAPPPEKSPIVYAKTVHRIELYTSIILPTIFLGFNFVYWPWLMASSQYYAQTEAGTTVIYTAS